METIKVYALTTNGEVSGSHCPLVPEEHIKSLELSFNHQVRGEGIIELEISKEFQCKAKLRNICCNCPFAQ